MTNQHSLSDAEDFTEGYRTLRLGQVVGEPTAGWIIYTWNQSLIDGTTFRLPRMKITANDGANMERNPRPGRYRSWTSRPIGETHRRYPILHKEVSARSGPGRLTWRRFERG